MKIFFIFLAILLFVIYILSTKEDKKTRAKYEPRGKVEEYWSGKERRRVERFEAMLDIRYRLLKPTKLKLATRSKDISEDGICILAHEILPKDSTVELEVLIPNSKEPLRAKGEVAWCEKSEQIDETGKRAFLTGIRFLEIENKDKANLVDYINAHLAPKGNT